jgi:hypothetical protein
MIHSGLGSYEREPPIIVEYDYQELAALICVSFTQAILSRIGK